MGCLDHLSSKSMSKMKNRGLIIFVAYVLLGGMLPGCRHQNSQVGFIVFDNPRNWYFIPAKASNSDRLCAHDFRTENLDKGMLFPAFQSTYLIENLDTINSVDCNGRPISLKIVAVRLEYSTKNLENGNGETSRFCALADELEVQFDYSVVQLNIDNWDLLVCPESANSFRRSCVCEKRSDDPNEYLYQICKYLQLNGVKGVQPCKYKIIEVRETIFDKKVVNEVTLDCCYLGDRAYFDKITNELVSFSFGPQ